MTLKSIAISTASNVSAEDHEYLITEENLKSHNNLESLLNRLKTAENGHVVIERTYSGKVYKSYIAFKHVTSFTTIEESI